MEKEFVPFELAVKLKKMGMNELCLTFYNTDGRLVSNDSWAHGFDNDNLPNENWKFSCLAPLWQQAFDWFREKQGLFGMIDRTYGAGAWIYEYWIDKDNCLFGLDTFEEAQEKCLEKLIEIVSC